jgi:hypothetical protein
MKKKRKENIHQFMKRRGKETGKITVPETNPSPSMSGGSHKVKALQMHVGIVKKKMAKHLEKTAKKKKKIMLEEEGYV